MRQTKVALIFGIAFGAALWATAGSTQPELVPATLTVDMGAPGATIAPEIYGQFIEHLGRGVYEGIWVGNHSPIPNVRGYRKDVLHALRNLEVPLLRWPGGCFAEQYDWRDGIGPRASRPTRLVGFYGNYSESNAFGTNEFLDLAEMIGAQPYISINTGSLPPLDAVRWLQYMTDAKPSSLSEERRLNGRQRPWPVRYVGIGNETWGCGGGRTAESTADMTRVYATFVNSGALDRTGFYKIAVGPSFNLPGSDAFTSIMMQNSRDIFGNPVFQALSVHYYYSANAPNASETGWSAMPATGFSEKQWSSLMASAEDIDTNIASVDRVMDKYDPKKQIALAVDEWGAAHATAPGTNPYNQYYQISLADAVAASLVLNAFHRHSDRVRIANDSMLANSLQSLILTKGRRMVLTPVYYIFMMYKPFKSATPYSVSIRSEPYIFGGVAQHMLDASAARATDGKLYLAVTNIDPHRGARVQTNLSGKVRGVILTGAAMDAHNDFLRPNSVHPVPFTITPADDGKARLDIPPKSVVVLSVG